MPPSRALFAERDGAKGTATWICHPNHGWRCASTSGLLKWMRGFTDPALAKSHLESSGYVWHWIEPDTARVLAPPF